MGNVDLLQWLGIAFDTNERANDGYLHNMILIFPSLDVGRKAISFMKTWPELNVAIVKDKSGFHAFHVYKKEVEGYQLVTAYTREGYRYLDDFLKYQPIHSKFAITCAYCPSPKEIVIDYEIEPIFAFHYMYTDTDNFHYQNISQVN